MLPACRNISSRCGRYATKKNCESNSFIRRRCQKSCGLCGGKNIRNNACTLRIKSSKKESFFGIISNFL